MHNQGQIMGSIGQLASGNAQIQMVITCQLSTRNLHNANMNNHDRIELICKHVTIDTIQIY